MDYFKLTYSPFEEPAEPATPDVEISYINFDGVVARVESDEYVEITNHGTGAADLSGWRLHADDRGQTFTFPSGTRLEPDASLRVYTNEVHSETGGFSYGSGRAIWNNKGDEGQLLDPEGREVSSYAYGAKSQL